MNKNMNFSKVFRITDLLIFMLNFLHYNEKLRIRFMNKNFYKIIKTRLCATFDNYFQENKIVQVGITEENIKILYEAICQGKMVIAGGFPTSFLTTHYNTGDIDIFFTDVGIPIIEKLYLKWKLIGGIYSKKYEFKNVYRLFRFKIEKTKSHVDFVQIKLSRDLELAVQNNQISIQMAIAEFCYSNFDLSIVKNIFWPSGMLIGHVDHISNLKTEVSIVGWNSLWTRRNTSRKISCFLKTIGRIYKYKLRGITLINWNNLRMMNEDIKNYNPKLCEKMNKLLEKNLENMDSDFMSTLSNLLS